MIFIFDDQKIYFSFFSLVRTSLLKYAGDGILQRYMVWTSFSVSLIMIAAILVRYISPQAAGAGVAEMKVIIRGVVIKEYLSFRTLVAKVAGVPFVLASGLGVGKEVRLI